LIAPLSEATDSGLADFDFRESKFALRTAQSARAALSAAQS
jgi:hypothetical protein